LSEHKISPHASSVLHLKLSENTDFSVTPLP